MGSVSPVSVRWKVSLVVVASALIPLAVFFGIAVGILAQESRSGLQRELEARRTAVLDRFQWSLAEVERNLEVDSVSGQGKGAVGDRPSTLHRYFTGVPLLDAVYEFGPDFQYRYGFDGTLSVAEASVPSDLRVKLQQLLFSRPVMVADIGLEDQSARIVLFRKLGVGSQTRYWAAVLSAEFWTPSEAMTSGIAVTLLNSHYQVLFDTDPLVKPSSVVITPRSQRMLQGFTEIHRWEGQTYALGNLDLRDTSVFLSVSPKNPETSPAVRNLVFAFAFFAVLVFLLGLLAAFALGRSVIAYGERLLAGQTFAGEIPFFTRMERTLNQVSEKAERVSKLAMDLNYLRNDLSRIREMLPSDEPILPEDGPRKGPQDS